MAIQKDIRQIARLRYVSSKLLPTAAHTQAMANLHGHIARYRKKMVYSYHSQVIAIPDSGPSVDKMRFYGIPGLGTAALAFRFGLARPNHSVPEFPSERPSPLIRITLTGSAVAGSPVTYDVHGGSGAGGPSSDVPSEWSWVRQLCDLSTAIDGGGFYDVRIQALNQARLFAICCYEVGAVAESTYVLHQIRNDVSKPIIRQYRETLGPKAGALWKYNAGTLFHWWDHNTTVQTSNVAYGTIDTGWKVETLYHNTVAQTAVPVTFALYSSTAAGSSGKAKIINASGGATIAEITGIGTTAQWRTAAGAIPAGTTECTFQIAGDGTNQHTVKAFSLFEHQS